MSTPIGARSCWRAGASRRRCAGLVRGAGFHRGRIRRAAGLARQRSPSACLRRPTGSPTGGARATALSAHLAGIRLQEAPGGGRAAHLRIRPGVPQPRARRAARAGIHHAGMVSRGRALRRPSWTIAWRCCGCAAETTGATCSRFRGRDLRSLRRRRTSDRGRGVRALCRHRSAGDACRRRATAIARALADARRRAGHRRRRERQLGRHFQQDAGGGRRAAARHRTADHSLSNIRAARRRWRAPTAPTRAWPNASSSMSAASNSPTASAN